MCLGVGRRHVSEYRYPQRPESNLKLELYIGGCEHPDAGAGN